MSSAAARLLATMNKHYVVATGRPGYQPAWRPYVEGWARAALILQTTRVGDPEFRRANPTVHRDYMGTQMSFETDSLYREVKRIHDETMAHCPQASNYILRSDDGVSAENPSEQDLV